MFAATPTVDHSRPSSVPDHVTLSELHATPHAEVFADPPRTVRLALDAGQGMAPHSHPGESVLFHVLEGELTLRLDGTRHDLSAGDLIRFDGDREVAPRAETDATALVVFAPSP